MSERLHYMTSPLQSVNYKDDSYTLSHEKRRSILACSFYLQMRIQAAIRVKVYLNSLIILQEQSHHPYLLTNHSEDETFEFGPLKRTQMTLQLM